MNAEFFALAFTAALNPKLLAIDLLLIENRRPRTMFLCLLLGGLTVGLTIGLLDVLVFHLDAIKPQKTVSAGVDLGLGLLLLAFGALVATGRLHARRKQPVPAGPANRISRRRRGTAGRGCWPSPGSGWLCWSAPCAVSRAPATSPACTS
ncbi:MAG: GAP family protein [Streptosporangiaceae bacterium]